MSHVDQKHHICDGLLFKTADLNLDLSNVKCPAHASAATPCSLKATTDANQIQSVIILFPDRPFRTHNIHLCCSKRPRGGHLVFGQSHGFDSRFTVNGERVYSLDTTTAISHSSLRIIIRHVMSATADVPSTPASWRTLFLTRYSETLCTEFDRHEARSGHNAAHGSIQRMDNEFIRNYVDKKALLSTHYFSKIKTYLGVKVIGPARGMIQCER